MFFFDASLPSRALLLFCSSALLLSTDDSQPPFQFLLRLAIAARSEQLGCQSAISCLVPTCEIIWRDCAAIILLCCNYLYRIKVNHALYAVSLQLAICGNVNAWQTWPRKRRMLSLHIWQCNIWECYFVAILILAKKNRDVVFVHLAICGKNTVCVAILVQ